MKAIALKTGVFLNADTAEEFFTSKDQEVELPDWLLKMALDGNGFKFLDDVSEAEKRFDSYKASLPDKPTQIKALHETFAKAEAFGKNLPYEAKAKVYNAVMGEK